MPDRPTTPPAPDHEDVGAETPSSRPEPPSV
jgi:hypothetical protein